MVSKSLRPDCRRPARGYQVPAGALTICRQRAGRSWGRGHDYANRPSLQPHNRKPPIRRTHNDAHQWRGGSSGAGKTRPRMATACEDVTNFRKKLLFKFIVKSIYQGKLLFCPSLPFIEYFIPESKVNIIKIGAPVFNLLI